MSITPSPRDLADVDFASQLVGSLWEYGSVCTTRGESVSGARTSLTAKAQGRLGTLSLCMSLPLFRDGGVRCGRIFRRIASTGGVSDMPCL